MILHIYTKNHNRMLYCSLIWRITDLIVIFQFGLFFTILPPSQPKKSKFRKNEKNPPEYIILQ